MTLLFDQGQLSGTSPLTSKRPYGGARGKAASPLRIALVNNMPDSALVATERQFTRLVTAAMGEEPNLSLYHIPELPRGTDARAILNERYLPVERLYEAGCDALIVTGNEPRAARLDEEPYWPDLKDLILWAAESTAASVFSCLAAHAAVLCLDGIERRRLPQKKSGALPCKVLYPAKRGLPQDLTVCHSRFNEVPLDDLVHHGYEIVSETADAQADVFEKSFGRSRFTFLQGHPEYDADSLMREYRRDVGRFLAGTRDTYPEVPERYFDQETVLRMENYRTRGERTRDLRLFERFPDTKLRPGLEHRLQLSARAIMANWVEGALAAAV